MLADRSVVFLLDVDNTLLGVGIDVDALAIQLQRDGAQAFVKSWQELRGRIAEKSTTLAQS